MNREIVHVYELSDSDEEIPPLIDEEEEAEPEVARYRRNVQLPNYVNLGVRQAMWRVRNPSDTNNMLVGQLRRDGSVSKLEIGEAMKCCPRDQFVPGGQASNPDVFADSPMRLESLGFNVSAPHIHASCLHALDLQPGNRVLDVGCGSGLLSAYAACLVGRRGRVVGIDTKEAATELARKNVMQQVTANSAFANGAALCEFYTHNVFLPSPPFTVGFDRIVVGASAPPAKLNCLLGLLKEEGGIIVSPVLPSDLKKITKMPDGSITSSLISKVRFSDLEVPKDVVIMKTFLDGERQAFLQPPIPESTFASDVASITGSGMVGPLPGSSMESGQSYFPSDSPSPSPTWARRGASFLAACGSRSINSSDDMDTEDSPPTPGPVKLSLDELGPYDCQLVGGDWNLPAHTCVLRARCHLLKAQSESGMRDAFATHIKVPEEFPKEAVAAFLKHCLTDHLEEGMAPQDVVLTLNVANYYGNSHLVQLCELALVAHLEDDTALLGRLQGKSAVVLAASLLALAEENGLPHLLACCLDFIVHHYSDVVQTSAYEELSKKQTDLIVEHACSQIDLFQSTLQDVASAPSTNCSGLGKWL